MPKKVLIQKVVKLKKENILKEINEKISNL